jgi:hypothetical protein
MYRGIAIVILILIIIVLLYKPKEGAVVVAPGALSRTDVRVTVRSTSGARDDIKKDIRFGSSN